MIFFEYCESLSHINFFKEVKRLKKIFYIILVFLLLFNSSYGFYEGTTLEDDEYYVETITSGGVPNLNARSAILYDVTYERILYEKNSREKRANASTTKMITAITAYEEGNLDDTVIISKKAASTGGSTINLKAGDVTTLDNLIKGLLVHSGNDAAVAIAEHISGSVEEFSQLMNEKALEIGAKDTHFITPHGLDEDGHYSTAYDLSLIAKRLLEIPYLANIVSQKTVEIEINGYNRIIGSTNEMLSIYEGANGVKTGFTGNAGRCIITSATKNGRTLISVVLGCDTKKNRTIDSTRLLDYGFEAFKLVDIKDYIRENICITVEKSEHGIYMLRKNVDFKYPLKEDESDKIAVRYDIKSNLQAPLFKGEKIATANIYLDGVRIGEIDYTLPENIYRKELKTYFKEILMNSLEKYR